MYLRASLLTKMHSIIRSYLRFIWKSNNAHGVHSPFVFEFMNACFYDELASESKNTIMNYRASLLLDERIIDVKDFGAGSRVFKSNKRSVGAIAKNAGITLKNAYLLNQISRYLNPEKSLEIGTSLGLATVAMLSQNEKCKLTTLEGCPETSKIAQEQLADFSGNVKFEIGEFNEYLDRLSDEKFDFIYFDGNHTEEATKIYFSKLLKTVHNETCWIFDDIHWSQGMENAWEWIKNQPNVTVTIDTFQWGIVFFRKEQVKENFILRPFKSKSLDAILGFKNLWGLIHYNNQ